jgi:CBS domain-containing protein
MTLKESLDGFVAAFMSTSFVRVAATDSVAQAARIMQGAGETEAIVVSDAVPLGIITERDILYRVVAAGTNPALVKVREIMSSPVQTIDEGSKVGEAIAKMSKLGIRRLGVTRKGKIIGMVTQKAMVTGNLGQNIALPELVAPGGFTCPYCNALEKSKEELSRHIDHAHMGGFGLLQGDATKW